MTTKHTPGPWTVHPRFDDGAEVRSRAQVAWCGVASTYGASGDQTIDAAEACANARLIAAAPDLLAACEGAVNMCPRDCTPGWYCGVCGVLFAAIAKAKGKT